MPRASCANVTTLAARPTSAIVLHTTFAIGVQATVQRLAELQEMFHFDVSDWDLLFLHLWSCSPQVERLDRESYV